MTVCEKFRFPYATGEHEINGKTYYSWFKQCCCECGSSFELKEENTSEIYDEKT